MIKYIINIVAFLFLTINTVCGNNTDPKPLSYDSDKITSYQNNGKYDYNSQLSSPEIDLWRIFIEWVERLLSSFFSSEFAEAYAEPVLVAIFILIILLTLFLVIRKRPELFIRNKKGKIIYEIDEETIYDVNFEDELNNSLHSKDYKMAVRLVYLQTLRHLNDNSYISWEPYKTPTEYIYEFKKSECKEEFLKLTNHFLRIRYGNFNATEKTYIDVSSLQNIIMKGIKS